ncbi:hypothetical protein Ami103574_08730 [Aminipila butyrica]|uniref:N(6)-L-threonylcarbamoyladenine synthase n=1 Tax=Aminipila butyrica TaxID=433296 RepID=A0A858BUY8_9FIRM|nr:hypothetical protein [Aminipila butyrica]QIB69407.1 hypothetical protein Ami103574_08730 [Aminipila butyrica]
MDKMCVLGIDTSNYRTSIGVIDQRGEILLDERRLLRVKQGERGLRQSEALFQHVENLPELFAALERLTLDIRAVAVSNKPRPVEGSYMPCFKAGYGFGKAVAHSLRVPLFCFSHQEGHLEAIKHYSSTGDEEAFLAWHLSGGTCELLHVKDGQIHIVGGSKDISFGQVIDRIGVLLGMAFPAGEEMDVKALTDAARERTGDAHLSRIKLDGLYFNLSGIETQCGRLLQEHGGKAQEADQLIGELFQKIGETITAVSKKAAKELGVRHILFSGGVSGSRYIRTQIKNSFAGQPIEIEFGRQELAGDNGIGIALLGGKSLWPSSR